MNGKKNLIHEQICLFYKHNNSVALHVAGSSPVCLDQNFNNIATH